MRVVDISGHSRARPKTAGAEDGASSSAQASASTQGTVRHRSNTTGVACGSLETSRGRQVRSEGGSFRGVCFDLSCCYCI